MRADDASVVICAYTDKRWDDLVAAVESVHCQTTPACETIVVIDHNPDLFQRARAHLTSATVIENHENLGLSGARNSGARTARGAIIAFLDDDAIAAPDWLANLLAGYADPRVRGVGGAIIPHWPGGRPGWFPEEFDWVVGCTYRGMPAQDQPVRNLIGCNMSFRREVFEEVGGFRSGLGRVGALPVGCEETELCIRLARRWPDARLLYRPGALVRHQVQASRATWRYFQARCHAEGRSKAQIVRLIGGNHGLSSERQYTIKTLPVGVLHGLTQALLRRDPTGITRAGAIMAGFGLTVTGYVSGGGIGWSQATTRNRMAM